MFANVNGTKIFFDVEGLQYVPDGPTMREKPVCFVLHGGPGSEHANFLPETSVLAEHMQLIYVDDRNCGRSERGDLTTSSIKQNVEDLEALRRYLGLGKVYLLGHSYGGMKAQRYMLDYPDSLHGVILAGTAGDCRFFETVDAMVQRRGTEEQKFLWSKGTAALEELSFTEYSLRMGSLYHYKYDPVEARNGTLRCIHNTEVFAYQAAELNRFNFLPELEKVKLPVLILVGEHDHITPVVNSEKLHQAMPDAEYHVIPDSAHEMFGDRPDFVFPCIMDFVNRTFTAEK